MADPDDVLVESTVDFESAFAYALSPDMRRLVIVFLAGWLLAPVGFALVFGRFFGLTRLVAMVGGLLVLVVAGTLLFGGLVGALFKLLADANRLAADA